jgi:fermentation-respiration switch protein FrsA (DUF1100 family)
MYAFGRKKKLVALALVVAAVAAAGTAYATIPDAGGVIHGCVLTKDGTLRVIDPSAGGVCTSKETALAWNQQGQPGPPGVVGRLDDLEGVQCKGLNGKLATVHLEYGSGIEAPVSIICITHLVANPGPFTVHVTSGTLSMPFLGSRPLPTSGWQFAGQIDTGGKITIPGSGFQLPTAPFDQTASSNGFLDLHIFGSVSFASTGVTGFLDPGGLAGAPGTASLTGGAFASITFTATATVLGQLTQLYSGTCNFGSAAAPLTLTLGTDPPGVPYSQSTGAVTLSAPFSTPSLDGCNPAIPDAWAFLLTLFTGTDRLTFSGTTDPIIKAP